MLSVNESGLKMFLLSEFAEINFILEVVLKGYK